MQQAWGALTPPSGLVCVHAAADSPSLLQVICTTLSGAAEVRVGRRPFKIVILDEASQATEPSTLIPLVRHRPSLSCIQHALPPMIQRAATKASLQITSPAPCFVASAGWMRACPSWLWPSRVHCSGAAAAPGEGRRVRDHRGGPPAAATHCGLPPGEGRPAGQDRL